MLIVVNMKVFVSWSGALSNKVAVILKDWIPNVLQSVELYVSSEDIEKGSRWNEEIARQLACSDYGILCITKENTEAPWLNFEAGALSNRLGLSKVCPLLYSIEFSEIAEPLRQFQAATFKKRDFLGLVRSINNSCGDNKLNSERLDLVFDIWWEHLYEEIKKIQSDSSDELGNVSNYTNRDRTTDDKTRKNVNFEKAKSVRRTLFEFNSFFKTSDEHSLHDPIFIRQELEKYSSIFLSGLADYSEILPQSLINDFIALITEMRSLMNEPISVNDSEFRSRLDALFAYANTIYEMFDIHFVE